MVSSNNKPNENNRNVLKRAWQNFALRMQNTYRGENNHAVIQFSVLVSPDGNPVLWTEPVIKRLEPRLEIDTFALKQNLTQDELGELLQILVK